MPHSKIALEVCLASGTPRIKSAAQGNRKAAVLGTDPPGNVRLA